jgi:hypothetical protein
MTLLDVAVGPVIVVFGLMLVGIIVGVLVLLYFLLKSLKKLSKMFMRESLNECFIWGHNVSFCHLFFRCNWLNHFD